MRPLSTRSSALPMPGHRIDGTNARGLLLQDRMDGMGRTGRKSKRLTEEVKKNAAKAVILNACNKTGPGAMC